jgi:Flp pilus assembly protein TadB
MINFYYILGIFSVILVVYYFYLDIVYREKFRNDLLKTIEEEIEEEIEEDSDGDEEGKEKSK